MNWLCWMGMHHWQLFTIYDDGVPYQETICIRCGKAK